MMSFDLPQIPVQETGIVVLAQAAVTIKRLENEPGPFNCGERYGYVFPA